MDITTNTAPKPPSNERRRFLVNMTTAFGAVGTVGLLVPFIASMNPSQRAQNAGAPTEIDVSRLQPGEQITVMWRGKPVWVLHRTADMLKELNKPDLLKKLRDPESKVVTQQPGFAQNEYRAIKPTFFVTIALCTHLGCIPTYRPDVAPSDLGADWHGGYYCPCHGSRFDLAGRVFKGVPAPTNLVIPPYRYISDSIIEIGNADRQA